MGETYRRQRQIRENNTNNGHSEKSPNNFLATTVIILNYFIVHLLSLFVIDVLQSTENACRSYELHSFIAQRHVVYSGSVQLLLVCVLWWFWGNSLIIVFQTFSTQIAALCSLSPSTTVYASIAIANEMGKFRLELLQQFSVCVATAIHRLHSLIHRNLIWERKDGMANGLRPVTATLSSSNSNANENFIP